MDGDIAYDLTTFVTRETGGLTEQLLEGTDFLVADGHAKQHMFTPAQQTRFESLLPAEMERGEETVSYSSSRRSILLPCRAMHFFERFGLRTVQARVTRCRTCSKEIQALAV